MQTFLLSDDDTTASRVRLVLLRAGLDCPTDNIIAPELASVYLAQGEPALVVLVMPADAERGLAALKLVRERSRARILVVGSTGDAKVVLRALRGGAQDYVDADDLEEELGAVLGRWRAERGGDEEVGRLIAVLAPSGGSGSSTLAANIATVLAKEHESAVLVDLKLHAGDAASLLDLKPAHTLADLCQNVSRMDHVLFERTLARHASGLRLLAAPHAMADASYVTAEGIRQVVAMARESFPYVVADLDHSFAEEQLVVLRQADIILLVIRLDFASLRNARRTIDHMKGLGLPADRLRLVVNRHGQPREVPAAKAEEALGVKIAHYVPEDAKTVIRAGNNGVPVVLEAPAAKVSRSLAGLAHSVNGRHRDGASANGKGGFLGQLFGRKKK